HPPQEEGGNEPPAPRGRQSALVLTNSGFPSSPSAVFKVPAEIAGPKPWSRRRHRSTLERLASQGCESLRTKQWVSGSVEPRRAAELRYVQAGIDLGNRSLAVSEDP